LPIATQWALRQGRKLYIAVTVPIATQWALRQRRKL
jgi:hypothetical protein